MGSIDRSPRFIGAAVMNWIVSSDNLDHLSERLRRACSLILSPTRPRGPHRGR